MIGQTLNSRYQIAERIGKGAMGTVYKAADLQTVGHRRHTLTSASVSQTLRV